MKSWWDKLGEPYLDEKEFKTNLGKGNFIFVGSSIDMFADNIPSEWITKVLSYCSSFDNHYLFQSKNPHRFNEFISIFPSWTTFGTTIETNRDYRVSKAPSPHKRMIAISELHDEGYEVMVSIEPIMEFDLDNLISFIWQIQPEFVSIGADSKNNKLPEPNGRKLRLLINELKPITEVRLKSNLDRLLSRHKT